MKWHLALEKDISDANSVYALTQRAFSEDYPVVLFTDTSTWNRKQTLLPAISIACELAIRGYVSVLTAKNIKHESTWHARLGNSLHAYGRKVIRLYNPTETLDLDDDCDVLENLVVWNSSIRFPAPESSKGSATHPLNLFQNQPEICAAVEP